MVKFAFGETSEEKALKCLPITDGMTTIYMLQEVSNLIKLT